jgi:hypothetical protein
MGCLSQQTGVLIGLSGDRPKLGRCLWLLLVGLQQKFWQPVAMVFGNLPMVAQLGI